MNLFHVQIKLDGTDSMAELLKDNYIGFGWQGIGDLENVSEADIKERVAHASKLKGDPLAAFLEEVRTFVSDMKDGDYVLVAEKDSIYLGDLGDYYYVEVPDAVEDGRCHRRGVTWLNCIPRQQLNAKVQELLVNPGAVARFKHPLAAAQLQGWAAKLTGAEMDSGADRGAAAEITRSTSRQVHVDPMLIEEALEVLKQAMRSEDTDRRERAAAAILQYAK